MRWWQGETYHRGPTPRLDAAQRRIAGAGVRLRDQYAAWLDAADLVTAALAAREASWATVARRLGHASGTEPLTALWWLSWAGLVPPQRVVSTLQGER